MGVKQNEIEIKDKLNKLTDKLATNLSLKGVSADNSMTLNTLADKVITVGDVLIEIDRNLPVVTYIDHNGVIYEVNTKDWTHNPNPIDYSKDEVPLTFQEWNQDLTLENIDRTLDYVIGATYIPTDGKSWFKIRITKTSGSDPIDALRQTIYYQLTGAGNTYINWGDSGAIDVITKTTAGQELKNTSHTYNDYGVYWISIWRYSGTMVYSNGSNMGFVGGNSQTRRNCLLEAYFGKWSTSLGEQAVARCYSLSKLTLPNNITRLENNSSTGINTLVIPKSITTIYGTAIVYHYALEYLSLPNKQIVLYTAAIANNYTLRKLLLYYYTGTSLFNDNYSIQKLVLPGSTSGVVGASNNYAVKVIVIPVGTTTVDSNGFQYNHNCTLYDFSRCKQVPRLANISAFNGINTNAIMKVHDNLYDEWITTTNWGTFSNYIMRASEYDKLYNN